MNQGTLVRRPGLLRLIAEHNPFYLLSATCMLLGCLLLTNSLSWNSIAVRRLLTLIVTLNVYEIALVGLALFLIAQRRLRRDGKMLLILAAFFLVDVTFLNAEIVTADFRTGLIVNIVLFVQAMAKLCLILRVLKPTVKPAQVAFIALQLLLLFALPCVLRKFGFGAVGARHFYAAWWIVGMLPAAYELFDRIGRTRHGPLAWIRTNGTPMSLYVVLPYLSLLLHVSILHYVYDARFYGADIAPVLLGLALVVHRAVPTATLYRRELICLRAALPAAAIFVSANSPEHLGFGLFGVHVTTLRIAIDGAYLTYIYLFLLPYAAYFVTAGVLAELTIIFGPTSTQMVTFADMAMDWIGRQIKRIVPQTSAEWGVVGLAASFAFLILGAAISLLKSPARLGSMVVNKTIEPLTDT